MIDNFQWPAYIYNMNSQNNADDSMNFSVIEPNQHAQPAADFSVQSLLGEQEQPMFIKPSAGALALHQSVQNVLHKMKTLKTASGKSIIRTFPTSIPQEGQQFLRDLSRLEKELSFQSQPYNIYEDNPNISMEGVPANKSKTYSCLKITKQSTNKSTNKSISKQVQNTYNEYYGPLIIDFKKQSKNGQKKTHLLTRVKSKQHMQENQSSSSQISSEYSDGSWRKRKLKSKSRSKEHFQSFFGRQKCKSPKNVLLPPDFRKSKSKSHNGRLSSLTKSHSNLKSSEAQNHSSKVFTEYYGTDINMTSKKPEQKLKKQQLTKIKSRQKSSRSKNKLGLLSPRTKPGTVTTKKK